MIHLFKFFHRTKKLIVDFKVISGGVWINILIKVPSLSTAIVEDLNQRRKRKYSGLNANKTYAFTLLIFCQNYLSSNYIRILERNVHNSSKDKTHLRTLCSDTEHIKSSYIDKRIWEWKTEACSTLFQSSTWSRAYTQQVILEKTSNRKGLRVGRYLLAVELRQVIMWLNFYYLVFYSPSKFHIVSFKQKTSYMASCSHLNRKM